MIYLVLNGIVIIQALIMLALMVKNRQKVKETRNLSIALSLIVDLDFIVTIIITWFLQPTLLSNIVLGVLIIVNTIFIGLSIRKWVKCSTC